jgi:adenine-specific DNA-methyltransferase
MKKLKMHTQNITDANIQRLAELFPNCLTESKDEAGNPKKAIDFDLLRQELSNSIVEGPQERYQLNWVGKKEAMFTANAPIAKTLRPYEVESVDFDTTQNLYIEGDNLEALKLLQETYLGKVKMIYIDPPYNTGNDFIYEDNFAENVGKFLLRSNQKDASGNNLIANTESNGRFHSDWLSMIYSRLKLSKNLLCDDGVIFISIDDHEQANLKRMCDEVFGEENFRNIFTLKRYDKNINRQFMDNGLVSFNTGFEYVLCYSKSISFKFAPVFRAASEDRQENGYWKGFWNDADRPTMRYNILGFEPDSGQWKWSEDKAKDAVDNYKKYQVEFSEKISLEKYWEMTGKSLKFLRRNLSGKGKNMGVEHWIPPSEGVLRNTSWQDIFASKATEEVKGLFDFPKNPDAIKLMLSTLPESNGDIILDFFSGSSSTAHAVLELNAEDEKNRKFIMVQIPEECDEKSEAFKTGLKTIAEIGKERIRRAGNKIKNENPDAVNLDVGFRVLKIDTSNMADVFYNPDAISQDLLTDQVENIKPDRTSEDLLFQVLLDWGVDLTLPISREKIADKEVFFVAEDALVACFDTNISEDCLKAIAHKKPLRVVFRDSGFSSDSVKINVEQIFKLISPSTEIKTI